MAGGDFRRCERVAVGHGVNHSTPRMKELRLAPGRNGWRFRGSAYGAGLQPNANRLAIAPDIFNALRQFQFNFELLCGERDCLAGGKLQVKGIGKAQDSSVKRLDRLSFILDSFCRLDCGGVVEKRLRVLAKQGVNQRRADNSIKFTLTKWAGNSGVVAVSAANVQSKSLKQADKPEFLLVQHGFAEKSDAQVAVETVGGLE